MSDGHSRWGQLTYASFGRAVGDGWGFGPSRGAHDSDVEFVRHFVRGSLKPVHEVSDFITSEEVDQLPIRFEYIPWGGRGLFMHTRPAGKDSSGRPGNTFTHIFIDHGARWENPQLAYPIQAYRSPDFRMPFLSKRVDAVELSDDADGPDPGPHFDVDLAWEIVRSMFMGIDRTPVVYRILDELEKARRLPVLLVNNSMDAQTWITVVSSLMSKLEAQNLFRFSTYERAADIDVQKYRRHAGRTLVAAPVEDADALANVPGVSVINTKDPHEGYEGSGTWASASNRALELYPDHPALTAALNAATFTPESTRLGDAMRQLHRNTRNT